MSWTPPKPLPLVEDVRATTTSYWWVGELRPRTEPARMKCQCTQCGGPLQVHEIQCSYCKSATGVAAKPTGAQLVAYLEATRQGMLSVNEARQQFGLQPVAEGDLKPLQGPKDEWR